MDKERRLRIIEAGRKAVDELIKVAEETIVGKSINDEGDELTSDKLKNAAATKKLSIFDAFDILNRIEAEESLLKEDYGQADKKPAGGFAEQRAGSGTRAARSIKG